MSLDRHLDRIDEVRAGTSCAKVPYPIGLRELEVLATTMLGSALLRVTLGGPGARGFESHVPEEHIRLIFPDEHGELRLPERDGLSLRWPRPLPVSREYTVRRHDPVAEQIDVDIAVHAGGVASDWAVAVRPGALIHVAGPPGGFVAPECYARYLLAGDLSALPARERQLSERVTTEIAQKVGDLMIAPARLPVDDHPPADQAAKNPPASRTAVRALAAVDRGDDSEAIALLGALAGAHPGDPLPRFLMGKIHFDRGRFADAERELDATQERAPDPPAWMAGWIELYRGLVDKARGRRAAAEAHFRAASEVRRFRSAERGILELQEGVPPHARCRP